MYSEGKVGIDTKHTAVGSFVTERTGETNGRKGGKFQQSGKILSQCINSSDSSFSSFLSAPKKKEVMWEASSLEFGSVRYSKINYHGCFP